MSISLASIEDWWQEGRWMFGDPINKRGQALICSSIVQRGEKDRDQSQNPSPVWNEKGMIGE